VPIPTRRLAVVVALASIVMVMLGSVSGFWLVNSALLVVAVVDASLARPRLVRVERDLPEVLSLHTSGVVTWRIHNLAGRRQHVGVADELAPSLHAGTRRILAWVRASAGVEASTTIRPTRRGKFTFGTVVVRADGPLGLAARQAAVDVPGVLRVYPPFRSRDEAELRINRARILEVGLR
jgi:uncharacterized protein (DUF58 family)